MAAVPVGPGGLRGAGGAWAGRALQAPCARLPREHRCPAQPPALATGHERPQFLKLSLGTLCRFVSAGCLLLFVHIYVQPSPALD